MYGIVQIRVIHKGVLLWLKYEHRDLDDVTPRREVKAVKSYDSWIFPCMLLMAQDVVAEGPEDVLIIEEIVNE